MKWLTNVCNFNKIPHGGMKSNNDGGMNGIPQTSITSSSILKGLSWSWMLPSSKSNPWGSPKNPTNKINLLNFPTYPPPPNENN